MHPLSGVRSSDEAPQPPASPATHSLIAVALDILVPYWGDPDLMRETVESVFAQDRNDWRLLVVDDAYPDPQISEWLGVLDDPRVTVVRHETNIGITANYRECLARATQEHVVFLGCDDVLLPDYVGVVQDAFAAVPEAVMVQPGVRVVDETGAPAAGGGASESISCSWVSGTSATGGGAKIASRSLGSVSTRSSTRTVTPVESRMASVSIPE